MSGMLRTEGVQEMSLEPPSEQRTWGGSCGHVDLGCCCSCCSGEGWPCSPSLPPMAPGPAQHMERAQPWVPLPACMLRCTPCPSSWQGMLVVSTHPSQLPCKLLLPLPIPVCPFLTYPSTKTGLFPQSSKKRFLQPLIHNGQNLLHETQASKLPFPPAGLDLTWEHRKG